MRFFANFAIACACLAAASGCAFFSPPAPHHPVEFDAAPPPHGPEDYPNWAMPPAIDFDQMSVAERDRAKYAVKTIGATSAGTTGAEEITITIPDISADIKFKAKPVPGGNLDGINNSPRKEMAAYWIQRLFLEPEDFVVPTTFAYCVDLGSWRKKHGKTATPNVKGLNCMLVAVSLWMKNVALPDPLYDEQRFVTDPAYAYYLSNFNVLTYIIGHRDGREGNFLVSKDDTRRQVFAIDNGVSFNSFWFNYFVPNWDVIRVSAVRRATVERLRELDRSDLDILLVVSQLEIDEQGIAHQVRHGECINNDKGAVRRGNTIQFGLTTDELDKVWTRITKLIEEVDSGELPVF
jgi:hypothetical protein